MQALKGKPNQGPAAIHLHKPIKGKEDESGGRKKKSENGSQGAIVPSTSTKSCQQVSSANPRPILPECKTDPDPPSDLLLLLLYLIYILLFLFHLGVFGHVFWTGKIIIVSCVNFRIKGRDKWRPNRAKVVPWGRFEERMGGHLSEGRIADAGMCN